MCDKSQIAFRLCECCWPIYLILQGFLTRDKGIEVESLDSMLKNKNIPDGQQDSFKRGFAEGFLKAQALTQRTQGKFQYKNTLLRNLLLNIKQY